MAYDPHPVSCALCGRTEEWIPQTPSDHFREGFYIKASRLLDRSLFAPMLRRDERDVLPHGKFIVCSNRRACRRRFVAAARARAKAIL